MTYLDNISNIDISTIDILSKYGKYVNAQSYRLFSEVSRF
jgi:hypothetical protein